MRSGAIGFGLAGVIALTSIYLIEEQRSLGLHRLSLSQELILLIVVFILGGTIAGASLRRGVWGIICYGFTFPLLGIVAFLVALLEIPDAPCSLGANLPIVILFSIVFVAVGTLGSIPLMARAERNFIVAELAFVIGALANALFAVLLSGEDGYTLGFLGALVVTGSILDANFEPEPGRWGPAERRLMGGILLFSLIIVALSIVGW